ncbi:TetR/AcrR family transcriptional regulator [Chitinophagaceae bacterium LWZ2-11]
MAKKIKADLSTEEKIKEAARKVFIKKGFSATRTRDIAEEAGMNLALLNYYFRSKEKLFDIVMLESLQQFLQGMKGVLNNEQLSLNNKINAIVDNYINLLKTHADLPLFILSEIKANPKKLAVNMDVKNILIKSHFHTQIAELTAGKINPLHIYMNILGMTVFPFVASPLLKIVGDLKQPDFDALMEERKKMIPIWINSMLKLK